MEFFGKSNQKVSFQNYLNQIEFEDLELVDNQIQILIEHIHKLKMESKEIKWNNNFTSRPSNTYPCENFNEMLNIAEDKSEGMRKDEDPPNLVSKPKWAQLFSLGSLGMSLRFISPEMKDGTPIAQLE